MIKVRNGNNGLTIPKHFGGYINCAEVTTIYAGTSIKIQEATTRLNK